MHVLLLAAGINFDVEAFKHELQRLAMPHQHFSFSQVSWGAQMHNQLSAYRCALVQGTLDNTTIGAIYSCCIWPTYSWHLQLMEEVFACLRGSFIA